MPKAFGRACHQLVPGSILYLQMPHLLMWTGMPLFQIQPNVLSTRCVFSAGAITATMARVFQVPCLFIYFQAFTLLPVLWAPIKYWQPADSASGRMDAKFRT